MKKKIMGRGGGGGGWGWGGGGASIGKFCKTFFFKVSGVSERKRKGWRVEGGKGGGGKSTKRLSESERVREERGRERDL